MKIVYNSPEHAKQRQAVNPLSMQEMNTLVDFINFNMLGRNPSEPGIQLLQRLIFEHENLQHMRETYPKWISVDDALPETYKEVLLHEGTHVIKGYLYNDNFYVHYGIVGGITHWQPLPPAPLQPTEIEVNEPENVKG